MSAKKAFLPYNRQSIDDDDIAAVVAALKSDFLTTGPAVAEFETAFAEKVEAAHAVVVSSGTAALHIAIMALDLGPGDAAIVPSVTFVATANAVRFTGADVIFADVDPDNGLMGPQNLTEALSRAQGRTVKAVLPVHLNGQPCDMESIHPIAQDNGLAVIEDACHALGGSIGNQPIGVGTAGQTTMFSLHPVKAIAMGEGGVLTTRDPLCAERFRILRNHGLIQARDSFRNHAAAFDANGNPNPWYYELHAPSPNYRASDIHCALGRSQLRKLESFTARRRKLAAFYDQELADLSAVLRPIKSVPWGTSGHHLYPVLFDFEAMGRDRASLMTALRERDIGTQVHYIPVHRQPYYADLYPSTVLPGADRYYERCLSLPLSVSMDEDDVKHVSSALHAELQTEV